MQDKNNHQKALAGVRVLDFTRVLAGPFCTMLLGDLGAEVIKVEHPFGGDETRQWGPPWFSDGDSQFSAYYLSVNRNKRSLTSNLKTEAGRELAKQLATKSQVLIENFKVGGMAEFGLGYDHLKPLNPGLVYCSITGFGQTGPYRDRPGYDYVVQAMSGLMSITGPAAGEPHKVGVAVADVFTGLFAASSILAALRHSEHTGEGQYIDIALLDSQIAALVNIASNYLISGQIPSRLGNEHPNIVPYQTFSASDQDFVLAVGNDRQFAQLCKLIGETELSHDPRFATNPQRLKYRAELVGILQAAFRQHTANEWVEKLLAAGIPGGPINNVAQSLNDPQVQARGLVHQIEMAAGNLLPLVGAPMRLSATPPGIYLPPPALGEHTDLILREVLGMDERTIAEYRASKTV
ncbi:MAG: CoA transferase [Anaerolineae bacterium]|nr:CoA transferase [Anaerolineae bacterium]